jgi:hypothetical protein
LSAIICRMFIVGSHELAPNSVMLRLCIHGRFYKFVIFGELQSKKCR